MEQMVNPRISWDDDGTLDYLFASDVDSVLYELLSDNTGIVNVFMKDGNVWCINFGAKNPKAEFVSKLNEVAP